MGSKVIVEEEEYFQVEELSEDGTIATLKAWAEGSLNGESRTIKVRWDEDGEIIRDGLIMRENHQVFCTVAKMMGKEVMGNFKVLPKDPRIMKMPDLVMDLIFSTLHLDDILNCRLTTPEWAFDNLPIQRILHCNTLGLMNSNVFYITQAFHPKDKYAFVIPPPNLPAIVEASDFHNLESLKIIDPCEVIKDEEIRTILKNSQKTRQLTFTLYNSGMEKCNEGIWSDFKKFISNNHENLQIVKLGSWFPEPFINLKDCFANCVSLETLLINPLHASSLKNVESLPPSITKLYLLQLRDPLSSIQVSLVTTNLTNLTRADLHVKHSCSGDDEEVEFEDGEVTASTISGILCNHASLKMMFLALGSWRDEIVLDFEFCAKVGMMKGHLENQLGGSGWDIIDVEDLRWVETLNFVKDENEPNFNSDDDDDWVN